MRSGLWLIGLLSSFRCALGNPLSLDPGWNVSAVESQVELLPSHCWEFGTASEALLELYSPMLSVFGPNPFPVPAPDPQQVKALAYAQGKIVLGTGANVLGDGSGAVGDPASLGVFDICWKRHRGTKTNRAPLARGLMSRSCGPTSCIWLHPL